VVGVFSVYHFHHKVVAVPGNGTGTRLEVWMHGFDGWEVETTTEIGGTVVSLVGDPAVNATFAACMDDGSVEYYRVKVVEEPLPPREPSWGDVYGRPVGLTGSALLGVIVVLLVLWRRRGRASGRA
jgi:hypothetical protein